MNLSPSHIHSLIVCGLAGVAVALIDNGYLDAIIVGVVSSLTYRFGKQNRGH